MTSRGIRNNNPGNIEKGINWDGISSAQLDARFITFISPEYGIRAMARILMNYKKLYGINTIHAAISRWAPPIENDTDAYADFVARWCGIDANVEVDLEATEVLGVMIPAMIKMENGDQPYAELTINTGVLMA